MGLIMKNKFLVILSLFHFSLYSVEVNNLVVPNGFKASLFANNLDAPRQIAEGDKGYIFVGSKKGIVYAPDYALNAGGVINCFSEVKGLSSEWAMQKAQDIYTTVGNIVSRSSKENIPTYQIANKMAEERIESIGKVKLPL